MEVFACVGDAYSMDGKCYILCIVCMIYPDLHDVCMIYQDIFSVDMIIPCVFPMNWMVFHMCILHRYNAVKL